MDFNCSNSTNLQNKTKKIEEAPIILIILLLICSAWIVFVNLFMFTCLLTSRHALKHYVNIQLLSLSVTDMIVGLSAVPSTLTYYISTSFPYFEACAGIHYSYLTAQTATLFHALGLCLHRFMSVKYCVGRNEPCKSGIFKSILAQVLAIWLLAAVLVAAPFARYGRFGQHVMECSHNTIFGNDYKKFVAILCVIFAVPLVGMNSIYIYMLRFLCRRWNRVRNTKEQWKLSTVASAVSRLRNNVNDAPFNRVSDRPLSGNKYSQKCINSADEFLQILSVTEEEPTSAHKQENRNSNYTDDGYNFVDSNTNKLSSGGMKDKHQDTKSASVSAAVLDTQEKSRMNVTELETRSGNSSKESKLELQRSSILRASISPGRDQNLGKLGNQNQKDVLYTIGMILILFDIFMTPISITMIFELIYEGLLSRKAKFIVMTLPLMNSAINPIVYGLRIKPFKNTLKHKWGKFANLFRSKKLRFRANKN